MLKPERIGGLSIPKLTGAVCGALVGVGGLTVLAGWVFHSLLLIQIAPHLAPMQRNTALSLALSGLALLGVVADRRRLNFICSGIVGSCAAFSLLGDLFKTRFGIDELLEPRT